MLLAIAILGLGLILIAAAYPIAVHWTAQNAHSTIAEVIAQDAAGIIRTQCAAGDVYAPTAAPTNPTRPVSYAWSNWTAIPGTSPTNYFATLQVPQPFVSNSAGAFYVTGSTLPATMYYWTAAIVPAPAGASASSSSGTAYDVYIFVFNKGDISNVYNTTGATPAGPTPEPQLYAGSLADAAFPIGSSGVDLTTGSVFRKIVVTPTNGDPAQLWRSDLPTPAGATVPPPDTLLYSPPATDQTASPLVYVFVFTVNL